MIVPQFWAEAREQRRDRSAQLTVRRFGWSDDSLEDAQRHARERVDQALARILAGDAVIRREPKVAYNGAEGVPIREEIVSRHGDAVVTRNSYGARCLNTPDVLFGDVDFVEEPAFREIIATGAGILGIGALLALVLHSWVVVLLASAMALVLAYPLSAVLRKFLLRRSGGPERRAMNRLQRFIEAHPQWHLRVYRTPRGLRLLAMHRTFDPREDAVPAFFRALGVDPIYQQMCLRQNCFRARISPKPWRIGIGSHLRPRPGVWPIDPERLPQRQRWVDAYEAMARGFAACRFVASFGSQVVHPAAEAIRALHDRECRSDGALEIA